MTDTSNRDLRLHDPLSDVTRRQRRMFLAVSMVGIAIVKTGFVPSKISALGIDFAQSDQKALFTALLLVVLYFLSAFVIYGIADFLVSRSNLISTGARQILKQLKEERDVDPDRLDEERTILREVGPRGPSNPIAFARIRDRMSIVRAVFEFALPIVVGLYAILVLAYPKLPVT